MKAIEFIRRLETSRKVVFSISDFTKILGKDAEYTWLFIHRLVKRGLLVGLERNKYTLGGRNPYLVASNIVYPSYISFLAAYSFHNITTQLPTMFHIVSQRQRKPVRYDGVEMVFVKMTPRRVFGFSREKIGEGFFFVAEKEKAIIDGLYLPRICPVHETFFAIKEGDVSKETLFSNARRMGSVAVIKRLGYLLERAGWDASGLRKGEKLPGHTLLDPGLKTKGKMDKRWNLIINREVEDAY